MQNTQACSRQSLSRRVLQSLRFQSKRTFRTSRSEQFSVEQLEHRTLLAADVVPIVQLDNPEVDMPDSSSALTRTEHMISVETNATGLVPGDAMTAWCVLFNNPEFCDESCAGSDLRNPEVAGALAYADGVVVGENGTATFSAILNEGDVAGVDAAHGDFPAAGIGLADASKAEVHVVMRTHGVAFPEADPLRTAQLTTFNGGCNTECTNVQSARHNSASGTVSSGPVHLLSDSAIDVAESDAKLTRYGDRIAIRVDTSDLVAGDAVTGWWVLFNNPEFCAGSCNGADLRNPDVAGALVYADGAVVGEDGKAIFTARLNVADVSGVDPAHVDFPAAGIGLIDASKAEVHFVMRTHGAAFPQGDPLRTEQLTTFNGGCNNECTNVQGVGFIPPNTDVTVSPVGEFQFVDETGSVQRIPGLPPIDGSDSRLTRDDAALTLTVNTLGLDAGAYTVWWVVFNNPEFCVAGCNGTDLRNPSVEGTVLYGTGDVVGDDGIGNFTAQLSEGDFSGVNEPHAGFPGSDKGLLDARKAEIHFVIRNHGPALEGDPSVEGSPVYAQTHSFNGGCVAESEDAFGCFDPQAGIHGPINLIILGDANDDGRFDQLDITHVLQAAKYRTGQSATFSEGDWNADGTFDQLDLVASLQTARYTSNPNAAQTAVDAVMADG